MTPTPQMVEVIDRISHDLATLRRLVGNMPAADVPDDADLVGSVGHDDDVVPTITLKSSYTKAAAEAAKREIEAAFEAGEIDYDKKRGMKMLVTKRTRGWSPVKSR